MPLEPVYLDGTLEATSEEQPVVVEPSSPQSPEKPKLPPKPESLSRSVSTTE